jgi:hypothetical protein
MWDGIYTCLALGVFMEVFFRLVHVALRGQDWYRQMSSLRQNLFSRHITTIVHHLLVVSGAALSLHYHNRRIFLLTLYLEGMVYSYLCRLLSSSSSSSQPSRNGVVL